jgi:hypothetical protein
MSNASIADIAVATSAALAGFGGLFAFAKGWRITASLGLEEKTERSWVWGVRVAAFRVHKTRVASAARDLGSGDMGEDPHTATPERKARRRALSRKAQKHLRGKRAAEGAERG